MPRSFSPPLDVVLWHARRGPSVPPPDGMKESGLCACGDAAYRSVGRHFPSEKGAYATTRAETVISPWWRNWPPANIGIPTNDSGLGVVIDRDPPPRRPRRAPKASTRARRAAARAGRAQMIAGERSEGWDEERDDEAAPAFDRTAADVFLRATPDRTPGFAAVAFGCSNNSGQAGRAAGSGRGPSRRAAQALTRIPPPDAPSSCYLRRALIAARDRLKSRP